MLLLELNIELNQEKKRKKDFKTKSSMRCAIKSIDAN